MTKSVTITYLEQLSPAEHLPKTSDDPLFRVQKLGIPLPSLNRYFYTEVGRAWGWTDRLGFSDEQWLEHAESVATFVGYYDGTPAGYFELQYQGDSVELYYFGLLPEFVGKGLGGALLSSALGEAWALEPKRVWVHTCSLDHPAALANYQARGFKVYKEETLSSG